MSYISLLLLNIIFITYNLEYTSAKSMVPVLSLSANTGEQVNRTTESIQYLPFIMLMDKDRDTSEYWRETEIISLVRNNAADIDYDQCARSNVEYDTVRLASRRTVRPICRNRIEPIPSIKPLCYCDKIRPKIYYTKNRTYVHKTMCSVCRSKGVKLHQKSLIKKPKNKIFNNFSRRSGLNINSDNNYQVCPQCPHFNNHTECELFRDSCKERKVMPSEYRTYCDRKYGKWRTMFLPADYSQCRCCDECIPYRELDQSCVADENSFDTEEFLPVITLDFRAGCNPYWGHPEQEFKALRCDKILRRCVPVSLPQLAKETLNIRRSFRFEPATGGESCPMSCRGYECPKGYVGEDSCSPGGFIPDNEMCNCCGKCSIYHQLGEKCAEFKKTVNDVNGTFETEVEEEFIEPGCDDGLVCRQGYCQDIHVVSYAIERRKRDDDDEKIAYEPCKRQMKNFKKRYGPQGHLHYNAPQCTPLWLFAPVQCRRFVCYCALEDGSIIQGIKVPRVEVSNMNCDCAREKCRTGLDMECDGYGNYKDAVFSKDTNLVSQWHKPSPTPGYKSHLSSTGYVPAEMLPTKLYGAHSGSLSAMYH